MPATRRSFLRALVIGILAVVFGSPVHGRDNRGADSYKTLVERVREGDYEVDFRELRMSYTRTKQYSPYGSGSLDDVGKAFAENEFPKAAKLIEKYLRDNYVSGPGHVAAMRIYEALGETVRVAHHQRVAQGLLASICVGTEGRTEDDPCPVIATEEEYFYIHNHGYELTRQALSTCGESPCDIMQVHNPDTGEDLELHFDITTFQQAWKKMFGE